MTTTAESRAEMERAESTYEWGPTPMADSVGPRLWVYVVVGALFVRETKDVDISVSS